jgi:hypothetical protein
MTTATPQNTLLDTSNAASGPTADTTQEVTVRSSAFGNATRHQVANDPANAESVLSLPTA